jgi:alginate O-acetyltransferase complex protein AlgI
MLFVEGRFFLFFGFVLLLYWTLRTNNARKWLILTASYFFYGSWDYRFAVMLLVLSTADWYFACKLSHSEDDRFRKMLVMASLAMNLSVLAYFKYFHFFVGSAITLVNRLGGHLDQPTLKIILPVGVSFFTFQSLSYTIDVYRRDIPPVRSLRDYLMFAAFFPQLVAGPIVRPSYFVPQMQSPRVVTLHDVQTALYLFLLGFLKKSCIADNISPYVDRVFADPATYSHVATVSAVWLYATQIFCDFSGYSDMAIAVAALLGYKLVPNFDAPYLAVSIQDFWRRWHISLSSWIRDYIYISLGGSRGGRWKTYRNLVLTMLAGGLWHGAAWTFVAWGGAHGGGQVIHQEFKRRLAVREGRRLWELLSWFLTLNFICICWILFRSGTFAQAWMITRHYLLLGKSGTGSLPVFLLLLPPALLFVQWIMRQMRVEQCLTQIPLMGFSLLYGAAWAFVVAMLPLGNRPFIYFQF